MTLYFIGAGERNYVSNSITWTLNSIDLWYEWNYGLGDKQDRHMAVVF